MSFRLALAQMRVDGGEKKTNLDRACERIAEAAAMGAQLVLLPEAMDLGWTHPSALTEAEPIPGGWPFERLRAAATDSGVYVCAGLTERAGDDVFNAAVLIGPSGDLLLLHRKLNELGIGHPYYAQGDRLQVCRTPLGTIGLMICADAFAQDLVLTRSLGYMGADIVISPCAWAVPADHDNEREPYGELWQRVYSSVAREFSLWIAGASNVGPISAGPWEGRRCIGCSTVVNPKGERVAFASYGVDADVILLADIVAEERPARGCGWTGHWARQGKS